jgi:hypothetical protein
MHDIRIMHNILISEIISATSYNQEKDPTLNMQLKLAFIKGILKIK